MVVVTHRDTHTPLLATVPIDRRARFESDLAERAVPVVVVEIIRRRVVGHKYTDPAVPVEVTTDDIEPVVTDRVGDSGLFRDVGERPVSVIAVECVARSGQPP